VTCLTATGCRRRGGVEDVGEELSFGELVV
jgi:hypothetical protein